VSFDSHITNELIDIAGYSTCQFSSHLNPLRLEANWNESHHLCYRGLLCTFLLINLTGMVFAGWKLFFHVINIPLFCQFSSFASDLLSRIQSHLCSCIVF
jgi:hypothetical protein